MIIRALNAVVSSFFNFMAIAPTFLISILSFLTFALIASSFIAPILMALTYLALPLSLTMSILYTVIVCDLVNLLVPKLAPAIKEFMHKCYISMNAYIYPFLLEFISKIALQTSKVKRFLSKYTDARKKDLANAFFISMITPPVVLLLAIIFNLHMLIIPIAYMFLWASFLAFSAIAAVMVFKMLRCLASLLFPIIKIFVSECASIIKKYIAKVAAVCPFKLLSMVMGLIVAVFHILIAVVPNLIPKIMQFFVDALSNMATYLKNMNGEEVFFGFMFCFFYPILIGALFQLDKLFFIHFIVFFSPIVVATAVIAIAIVISALYAMLSFICPIIKNSAIECAQAISTLSVNIFYGIKDIFASDKPFELLSNLAKSLFAACKEWGQGLFIQKEAKVGAQPKAVEIEMVELKGVRPDTDSKSPSGSQGHKMAIV